MQEEPKEEVVRVEAIVFLPKFQEREIVATTISKLKLNVSGNLEAQQSYDCFVSEMQLGSELEQNVTRIRELRMKKANSFEEASMEGTAFHHYRFILKSGGVEGLNIEFGREGEERGREVEGEE